jgi:hypothetical protein
LETTIFRDRIERHPQVEDQICELYTNGLPFGPRKCTFAWGELFPLRNKEDQIRRFYTIAVSLMPTPVRPTERRGLTRDKILSMHTTIMKYLVKNYDPSVVDN